MWCGQSLLPLAAYQPHPRKHQTPIGKPHRQLTSQTLICEPQMLTDKPCCLSLIGTHYQALLRLSLLQVLLHLLLTELQLLVRQLQRLQQQRRHRLLLLLFLGAWERLQQTALWVLPLRHCCY
jgi:hypothetical protein